ncbi:AsmA family protein [Pseudodesulfovibrio sp.]|uniref:AsmA family protein n=1 Tax=Pseudodesulfovibrio sp. TaxID=2035812 RepID=UPI00260BCE04|nr:AsmA family protein [Pseudodesulfovibrio sp.]MDD3312364.1 AsmA family protein [Pseudodesulfovibrio sp.]
MTKAVHITLWTGGILAALIVVAVAVFAATFDINDYKTRIAQVVRDETGRTLDFTGDLKLMFFPRLGVVVHGATLSNAAGFGDGPMASVKTAGATFRLRPLLSGDVQLSRLYLDGLTLRLARNAEGVTNWADLAGDDAKPAPAKPASSKGIDLDVDGVTVKDSAMSWDDRKGDAFLAVSDVALELGAVRAGGSFPLKGSLVFSSSNPEARGTISISGTASLAPRGESLTLAGADASVAAEGKAVPGGQATAQAKAESLTLAAGRLEAKGLALSAYGATVHFDGSVDGLAQGVEKLVGTVVVDPFDGRALWKNLTGREPATADAKALAQVGGTAVVAYTPRSLALKGLDLTVDGNGLRGDAKVAGDENGVSCYVRLDGDTVDLDRYLPAVEKAEGGSAGASAGDGQGPRILDARLLRRLTVDAEATLVRLHVMGVWLDKVKAGAQGRDGLIRLNPAEAELYGGHVSMAATVNALTDRPRTDLLASLDKVDVGRLSKDALGEASYAGKLDFKGTFACEGERLRPMLASMNGKFNLDLADGVFPGVDLLGMARTTQASGKQEGTVVASASDATRFGSITGTGVIKNGVLENRDLDVKAPGLRAAGEGAVSLPTGAINYLVKVKLVASSQGQGGKSGNDMLGIMVPVRVTGTVSDPHYSVSLSEYVKALGGAVIGVAGTVFKGVTGVITTVGKTLVGAESSSGSGGEAENGQKKNGLHNLFGLF